MTRRLLLTSSAAAWLSGLYLLYAHLVSPVVEPTQLATQTPQFVSQAMSAEDARPSDQELMALEHLPDQEWVKDAANTLHIGDMFLYFNEFEEENQGAPEGRGAQVRFSPFALVWKNPQAKPDEAPRLRITADAAIIQFESAFDYTNSTQGRPISGSLVGEVHIEGPNGLQIRGRGFNFNEASLRLWCDSDIQFHYGPHHGTGHGLQVDFLPGDDTLVTRDMPRLGGVRTVSLLREVVLNLIGEAAGPSGKRRTPLKEGDELKVVSDGRMQYDLEANLMTFDHNVQVRHPLLNNQQEGVNCDLLTLVLSQPKVSPEVPQDSQQQNADIALTANEVPGDSQDMDNWLPKKLQLDKLLADGSGKRRVEIFSQPRNMHCNAAQVEYDLQKRVLNLRDPATVDVLQGPQQLHAPEITLTLHENNRDIRHAVARGIGTASTRLADGRTVSAKWQKQLVKSTDPKAQVDIVELQGAASINLDQEYELSGDALHFEVTPLVMGAKAVGSEPSQVASRPPPPRIERVAGVGDVVLKSPQATAHTQRLDVTFQAVSLPPQVAGEKDSLFGLQSPDGGQPVQRGRRRSATRETPAIPLDVTANSVTALISRDTTDEKRMALAELWADDAVTVTQPLKLGEPPVQMLGKHLHVQNVLPAQQLVSLTGAPAQIRSGLSRLEGGDIRLNRQQNTLKVLGPGVLQNSVGTGLNGQPLDRPQVMQVKWTEKLDFDGKTADFYEKVEASLQQTVMRCSAMHVTLLNPLRFDDPRMRKLVGNRLQLAKISCENKVELDAAEYQGNIIISRSFGHLGQFVVDNTTGKTEAMGPGYFVEWRRGQRTPDSRSPANKVARPTVPQNKIHDWTYSRIDFQGLMKGNVHERFTKFYDHVEIVYGPVPHATDRIDPDELPEGAAAITCDALTVEQYAENAGTPAFVKLSAEGNTKLEMEYYGHPIYAQADEVKFDESKDFYLLRGQKVIINREPTTDDPRARVICSRVEINRGQRKIKFSNATGLSGVQ